MDYIALYYVGKVGGTPIKQLKDLREYLSVLDSMGGLQKIDVEVDWNLEIGAIIRRAYDLRAPAPLSSPRISAVA